MHCTILDLAALQHALPPAKANEPAAMTPPPTFSSFSRTRFGRGSSLPGPARLADAFAELFFPRLSFARRSSALADGVETSTASADRSASLIVAVPSLIPNLDQKPFEVIREIG